MNCPSRRRATVYETRAGWFRQQPNYADLTLQVARADYAANGGDIFIDCSGLPPYTNWGGAGPDDYASGVSAQGEANWRKIAGDATGVIYPGSWTTFADVRDGTGSTYLLGEKYINPDWYTSGEDSGDSWSMYTGGTENTLRFTVGTPELSRGGVPMQDRPGWLTRFRFGSAHPGGWNVVFCDGSVHTISYSIAADVHRRLGNRKDGEVVDGSKF